MIRVTREGVIVGDYWQALREVERERAKEVGELCEQRQREDYEAALSVMNRQKKIARRRRVKHGDLD